MKWWHKILLLTIGVAVFEFGIFKFICLKIHEYYFRINFVGMPGYIKFFIALLALASIIAYFIGVVLILSKAGICEISFEPRNQEKPSIWQVLVAIALALAWGLYLFPVMAQYLINTFFSDTLLPDYVGFIMLIIWIWGSFAIFLWAAENLFKTKRKI